MTKLRQHYSGFILLAIALLILYGFRVESNEHPGNQFLAVQLIPTYNDAVTYSVVTVHEGKIVRIRHITRQAMVMIAMGKMQDAFNPSQQNLLEQNGISGCAVTRNEITRKTAHRCDCIDHLWKLRYPTHPLSPDQGAGWARDDGAPDDAQMTRLREFGIERLHDIVYGEQLFALLRAVSDPDWVAAYQ